MEPKSKRAKTSTLPTSNLAYFKEQGLEVFLDKLRVQGWQELFTNTQIGCYVPDLTEFYAHCSVNDGVVTSEVNGTKAWFDAKELGEILGVPTMDFDLYVREDKYVIGFDRLLELAQKFSPLPGP